MPPSKSTQKELATTTQTNAARAVASLPAIISIIETNHIMFGRIPNSRAVATQLGLQESHVSQLLSTPEAQKMLTARGISPESQSFLLPEQIAAANVMLDYADSRSQAQKLRALGVTSAKWTGWLADPIFSRYYKSRAESLLDQAGVGEAHTALLKQVTKGNVQAIKLAYEVTGRHRDSTSLNVEFFLQRVIEIIQLHEKDPLVLSKIAEDFKHLMGEVQ